MKDKKENPKKGERPSAEDKKPHGKVGQFTGAGQPGFQKK